MSTFSDSFSSETTGSFEAKFHVESPWDGRWKICSNGPRHMKSMTVVPIYDKNLKQSSSPEPKSHDLETWYAASSAQVLPHLPK